MRRGAPGRYRAHPSDHARAGRLRRASCGARAASAADRQLPHQPGDVSPDAERFAASRALAPVVHAVVVRAVRTGLRALRGHRGHAGRRRHRSGPDRVVGARRGHRDLFAPSSVSGSARRLEARWRRVGPGLRRPRLPGEGVGDAAGRRAAALRRRRRAPLGHRRRRPLPAGAGAAPRQRGLPRDAAPRGCRPAPGLGGRVRVPELHGHGRQRRARGAGVRIARSGVRPGRTAGEPAARRVRAGLPRRAGGGPRRRHRRAGVEPGAAARDGRRGAGLRPEPRLGAGARSALRRLPQPRGAISTPSVPAWTLSFG